MRVMIMLAVTLFSAPAWASPLQTAAYGGCQQGGGFDPISVYGDEVAFVVRRNGRDVGEHRTVFSRDGGVVEAVSEMTLKVKVLFITAYKFTYRAESRWCDDTLLNLSATTNRNGDQTQVMAVRHGQDVAIDGPKGVVEASGIIFPTEHWHPDVLMDDRVINTITGGINQVAIKDEGPVQVAVADGSLLPARHYRYTGQLETEVWYDAQGRWVKLRFAADDGSTIEYVCATCAPGRAG